ncbi:MAG: hypothetical protein ACOC56_01630 [Atribacterota bacterium]
MVRITDGHEIAVIPDVPGRDETDAEEYVYSHYENDNRFDWKVCVAFALDPEN